MTKTTFVPVQEPNSDLLLKPYFEVSTRAIRRIIAFGKRSLLFRKTGYILFLQCVSHCVQKEYSRGLGKNRHITPSAAHIREFQIPLRENFSLFWFSCNSMFKKEDPDPALYYK